MTTFGLYWLGLLAGFAGVVVYFGALAMRPRWVRVLNGSGLFFTGLGLMQLAVLVRSASLGGGWINANVAVIALALAVAVQSYAILRNRRIWDGVDRRAARAQTPPGSDPS